MNELQKKILLKVARDSVEAAVTRTPATKPHSDDPDLNKPCGCFVTLKNGEDLRGCIGQFVAERPLIEMVSEMAKASATGDPRFFSYPITEDELNDLDIEISVLSPLKKTDNPLSLRLGIDGIYIKKGPYSGCFLPQVATETGWSKEEFLSYCCSHKAGLSPNDWRDKDTDVFLFTAEIFSAPFRGKL
jgi:AmmeMemoRadiSam system protein A